MSEPGKTAVLVIGGINEEPHLFEFIYDETREHLARDFADHYIVLQPDSVSEALHYAATQDVPLIVVGYDVAEMEGIALGGALKDRAPQSTVLLILPYKSIELEDEAKAKGIDKCLARPFNLESYERILRATLFAHVRHQLQISVPIGATITDRVVSLTRGGLGAIPIVGSIVSEVVGNLIPNQRIDRFESFLRILAVKVQVLSEEHRQQRFRDPCFVDLFEDGMYQAARALSDERLHYIAALLKNSLSDEEVQHLQDKHLLQLLGELNDAEVIVLKSQSFRVRRSEEARAFREQHATLLQIAPILNGSPQPDIDRATIHRSFNQHLMQLGLFTGKFGQRPGKGSQWDTSTGMLRSDGYDITRLGMLLLRRIDLAEDSDER